MPHLYHPKPITFREAMAEHEADCAGMNWSAAERSQNLDFWLSSVRPEDAPAVEFFKEEARNEQMITDDFNQAKVAAAFEAWRVLSDLEKAVLEAQIRGFVLCLELRSTEAPPPKKVGAKRGRKPRKAIGSNPLTDVQTTGA